MDEILRKTLADRMRAALDRGDNEELQRAQVDAMCAQMECQEKVSNRVKKIEVYLDRLDAKSDGAKIALKLIGALGSAGAGAAILKAIQSIL